VRSLTKRAIVAAGAAFGFKPAGPKWVPALIGLKGTFERTGSQLAIFVALLVWVAGVAATLAAVAFKQYRYFGWWSDSAIFCVYGIGMVCLLYLLVSRANLRYVFGDGRVSAYNTWGQLLWSEDLTGLKYVTFFTGRGGTSMTLFWADRKRGMSLFESLKSAIDASE
jgi:hypothetical protein